MALKKYINRLTYRRWTIKDPKDSQLLVLVGVAEKIMDDNNKSSDKSEGNNKEPIWSTKGEKDYIKDIQYYVF